MKVHDLQPAEGAKRNRKRVGRGIGSGVGKTAGRGTKGQRARNTVPVGSEGGQTPLHIRVPKLKGFKNPFRVEYQAINLDTLAGVDADDIGPETLHEHGLVRKGALVKVLGRGEIDRAITVRAHAFSAAAEAAITEAGGSIEKLPLPWGDRRRPAVGNQFTNR